VCIFTIKLCHDFTINSTRKCHEINCLRFSGYYLVDQFVKIRIYGIFLIQIAKIIFIQTSPNCDVVDLTLFSHFKHFMLGLNQTLAANSYFLMGNPMNNCNCLNMWLLTGSARIPRGVNKFPGGRKPLRALQHVNFVNRKLFHLNYFFEVMGDLKQRTIS